MRRSLLVVIPLAVLAAGTLAGCESTQSKSARIQAQAAEIRDQEGLEVKKVNDQIKVMDTTVLDDGDGNAAVVVTLRNMAGRGFANLPIAVTIVDKKGKAVYKNDEAGLEGVLTHVPLIGPGETVDWVSDGLYVEGEPADVKIKVGHSNEEFPREIPEIRLQQPKLESDETLGTSAVGEVTNDSGERQQDLAVFAVARKGGEVTAAGTAIVRKIGPDKSADYHIFFIGNPDDGDLRVALYPTLITGGST